MSEITGRVSVQPAVVPTSPAPGREDKRGSAQAGVPRLGGGHGRPVPPSQTLSHLAAKGLAPGAADLKSVPLPPSGGSARVATGAPGAAGIATPAHGQQGQVVAGEATTLPDVAVQVGQDQDPLVLTAGAGRIPSLYATGLDRCALVVATGPAGLGAQLLSNRSTDSVRGACTQVTEALRAATDALPQTIHVLGAGAFTVPAQVGSIRARMVPLPESQVLYEHVPDAADDAPALINLHAGCRFLPTRAVEAGRGDESPAGANAAGGKREAPQPVPQEPAPKRARTAEATPSTVARATWDDELPSALRRDTTPSPTPDDWDRLAHDSAGAVLCDGKAVTLSALCLAVEGAPVVDTVDEGVPAQLFTDRVGPSVLVVAQGPRALAGVLVSRGDGKSISEALAVASRAYHRETSHWPDGCGLWAAAETPVELPDDMPPQALHRLPADRHAVLVTRGSGDRDCSAFVAFDKLPQFVPDDGRGLKSPSEGGL